jgi:hypothetical protein
MTQITVNDLTRKRGPKGKYTLLDRAAFLQAVASSPHLSVREICELRNVSSTVAYAWIKEEKEKLGDQATSLDPPKINHAEEGHVSIQAHSTSATTSKDTEEENGRTH